MFGSNKSAEVQGGVVVYQWSQYPSTRTDTLNLMFQTSSKDATLVLVKGKYPIHDFFRLTIVSCALWRLFRAAVCVAITCLC